MEKRESVSKKRKRSEDDDPLQLAYKGVTLTPRATTGRPGTPHSFFKHSYSVSIDAAGVVENVEKEDGSSKESDQNKETETSAKQDIDKRHCVNQQVIHQHANGLCIVTAGDLFENEEIEEINVVAKEAPDTSAAERRKRTSKMLHRKNVQQEGVVTPTSIIAEITVKGDKTIKVHAGAWGHLLELNKKLTPELLQKDPLLNGYIAVILPTGPFPPPLQQAYCKGEITSGT